MTGSETLAFLTFVGCGIAMLMIWAVSAYRQDKIDRSLK